MTHSAVKVLVFGRVQGVFFRYHTKLMADNLGLSGWVRNLPDGSVETLCSGTSESVNRMLDWLRQGPESAAVDRISIDEAGNDEAAESEFTIRY